MHVNKPSVSINKQLLGCLRAVLNIACSAAQNKKNCMLLLRRNGGYKGERATPTRLTDSAGFLFPYLLVGSWWAGLWGCTTLWAEVARRTRQSCGHSLTRRAPIAYQVTTDTVE